MFFILKKQKKDGETAAAYLIFYSAGRFVLEFFRGDLARGSVGALSTSQFISLFTFVVGIVLLLVFSENETRHVCMSKFMEITDIKAKKLHRLN